ncbi:Capsule polysaccharide biosynthesis protein [Ferrimonas balearica DSM 9799]|uniref:Capsule polysaccharide biosynthesis protein n=1 Tax=Ferrimonas balearica (strain DSM 9799 / CCM 4581 / KCTC 23876 / PAT) TaxID=550540 RepID=E1SP02_FERBD|nr:capsular polysaccharide biosynthesis protein [Ferrimonas balearica]ADN74651.1 Capsule polysaccharide biosynthesis protein [Ferrimonas balearica DSM 9799]
MTYYTNSAGILARQAVLHAALAQPLERLNAHAVTGKGDVYIGWGLKPNSLAMKQQAAENGVPFWHLEDGFIGYTGHPAKGGHSLSVVVDKQGIYYDASQPSELEQHIVDAGRDSALCERAHNLIARIRQYGITKYNVYPDFNSQTQLPSDLKQQLDGRPYVLLVDQVAGDLSIAAAQASEADFLDMVAAARQRYPDAALVVRTHPDTRLGKKSGVLARLARHPALQSVIWVKQACHPHALIHHCLALFTVSSQMGFEGLILDKPVHCFGQPFYAGWGLTDDAKPHDRRAALHRAGITLPQLVAAALILYPRYVNPITGQRCEVEEIIELLALQQRPEPQYQTLYLAGFSLWKRAFIGKFCGHLAHNIRFVSKPPKQLGHNDKLLVWGQRFTEQQDAIRVEDGFVRSSGLGSNLCRPASLVVDQRGIYFNAQQNNDLRHLLNHLMVSEADQARGAALIHKLVSADINKYNLISQNRYQPSAEHPLRLLVVGQVDGDASITTGSPVVTSNEALLWAVRKAYPEAHILYKAHPDVVAGNREGQISQACYDACVDEQVAEYGLNQLYPHIHQLHTMTSLAGFEALLRGIHVVTWGQPFYAGWGLTEDRNPAHDRNRQRTLEELVYIAIAAYPSYVDWATGLFTTPEWLIDLLANNKTDSSHRPNRFQRWQLKLGYLVDTLKPQ